MNVDKKVLYQLLSKSVNRGYSISVVNSNVVEAEKLIDVNSLISAAFAFDEVHLNLYTWNHCFVGTFFLVYNGDGNIICDHSDTEICTLIANEISDYVDNITDTVDVKCTQNEATLSVTINPSFSTCGDCRFCRVEHGYSFEKNCNIIYYACILFNVDLDKRYRCDLCNSTFGE